MIREDPLLKYYDLPREAAMVVPAKYTPISSEERTRRVKELNERVRENVVRIQKGEEFRNFLIAMAHFHRYSWNNQFLIWMQRPDATRVAGYNTWRDMGRYVKKGEKGIEILAPLGPTAAITWHRASDDKVWAIKRSDKGWAVHDDNGDVEKDGFPSYTAAARYLKSLGFVEHRQTLSVNNFKIVHVFDIKQTEGKPLPGVEIPTLTTAFNQELWDGVMALCNTDGVEVSFDPEESKKSTADGWLQKPNKIWVRPENPKNKQENALLHEYSHYNTSEVWHIPRGDAETIAESAAFVIGSFFGFDTGVISFPYVAIWARDEKTLYENMKSIQEVSEKIIDRLEQRKGQLVPQNIGSAKLMAQSYSLDQLKEMARRRGVSQAGTKEEIIKRLQPREGIDY